MDIITTTFTETGIAEELVFVPNGTEVAFLNDRGEVTVWTKGTGQVIPNGTPYFKPADLEMFA